ncbi:phage late control D family protein [Brevibacillus sp. SYSU BS000544]|uniref:phage late control D family protein n=1 Tax=Brevibacillus sp. SYSU BS000544 TaxID=3416443 RepID=UPI003CE540AA
MDIEQLAFTYSNFYVPVFEIEVEGENIIEKGVEVVSVNVDNTLKNADHFTFIVNNAFDIMEKEVRWLDQLFTFGKKVKVKMGYANQSGEISELVEIFIGLITSVTTRFPSGGLPQMEVSGYDLSHCMMKGLKSRSWERAKHSDIARDIANYYKLKSVIHDTGVLFPKVVKKDGISDFQFLQDLAKKNAFEFFVFCETLYFRAPDFDKKPIVTLEWGKSLVSFNPEINVANLVTKVEVRGWDAVNKKVFIGKAKLEDLLGRNDKKNQKNIGEMVQQMCKESIELSVQYPVFSQQEADKLAKSILKKHTEGLVTGSGETIGIPKILAGENILLLGLGKKFSKKYYIEQSNHSFSSSGYRTTFNIKENII